MSSITIDRWALVSGPALRRVPWVALGTTIALSTAVVWSHALAVDDRVDLLPAVRVAVVLIAAAAATCLEDPTELLVDSMPVGRLSRRVLSVVMTGLVALLGAGALLAGAALLSRDSAGPRLPVGGLLIEVAAASAFGWMLAAGLVAGTAWRGSGVRAAAGVVFAALFSVAHPDVAGWLWVPPGPGWRPAHEHWAIVGMGALVMFVLLSRDATTRVAPSRTDTA